MAALVQAFKPFFRLHSCRSSDPVHGRSFHASTSAFDRAVQPFFMYQPYNVRNLSKSGNSAHDSLSFKKMNNTVELIGDLLRLERRAILSCKAQQLAVCHTCFCAHESTLDDSSTSLPASTSRDTCMMGALAFEVYVCGRPLALPKHPCENVLRSCDKNQVRAACGKDLTSACQRRKEGEKKTV